MNITKKDLSYSLKEEVNFSKEESSVFVDEFFISLSKALNKNPKVKISGFGNFYTKPRIGRNPKTKESFPIPSKEKVKFAPTKKTKNMLN